MKKNPKGSLERNKNEQTILTYLDIGTKYIYIYMCVCFFLLFIYCHSLLWNYGFLRTFPLAKIFLGLSLNPTHHHLALHRIHQSWSSKLTLTLWSCISPIITYHFGIIRFAYIITMRILKVMLATCINTEDLQKYIYIYICIYIYMYICIYGGCPKYLFPDSPQSLSQSRSNRGTTVSNRGRVCSSLIRSYT